jgi:hypothetical protein
VSVPLLLIRVSPTAGFKAPGVTVAVLSHGLTNVAVVGDGARSSEEAHERFLSLDQSLASDQRIRLWTEPPRNPDDGASIHVRRNSTGNMAGFA